MKIAVLGTIAVGLVAEVDRLPRPGETVLSRGLTREPAGMGTLQAIAAARLGAEVALYGRIGADPFGDEILTALHGAGVDIAPVERMPRLPTGASLVLSAPNGQFLAAHAAGANAEVNEGYVISFLPQIREVDALLLDHILPLQAVAALLRGLPPTQPLVVLHPMPLVDAPSLPWERVDFIIGGHDAGTVPAGAPTGAEEAARLGQPFLDRGVRHVVTLASGEGAYLVEKAGTTRFPVPEPLVPSPEVRAAFSAALAVRLAAGRGPYEAVGFANAAATLAAARREGPRSFPTAAEVQESLSRPSLPPG